MWKRNGTSCGQTVKVFLKLFLWTLCNLWGDSLERLFLALNSNCVDTNTELKAPTNVVVGHVGGSCRRLESWAHVLDGAQWMKVTKCPTAPLPLIHRTHSFLNAVIRPRGCSTDWVPGLSSLQVYPYKPQPSSWQGKKKTVLAVSQTRGVVF